MSKKKSEKEAKEKKQAAKKSSGKGKSAPAAPETSAVVEVKKPKPKAKATPGKKVKITNEDIALRAYYIAERREKMGWSGDSTNDWVEAERQLRAEAAKK